MPIKYLILLAIILAGGSQTAAAHPMMNLCGYRLTVLEPGRLSVKEVRGMVMSGYAQGVRAVHCRKNSVDYLMAIYPDKYRALNYAYRLPYRHRGESSRSNLCGHAVDIVQLTHVGKSMEEIRGMMMRSSRGDARITACRRDAVVYLIAVHANDEENYAVPFHLTAGTPREIDSWELDTGAISEVRTDASDAEFSGE